MRSRAATPRAGNPPSSAELPSPIRPWKGVVGAALIAALLIAAYLPSLHGDFVLDDDQLLTQNKLVRAPDGLRSIWWPFDLPSWSKPLDYWPVTNTTLWMEWRLWGLDPTGYHLTNLMLHFAASLLIWTVLSRLSIPGALLAAILFAVHPVNVESVAWIAQRKNTLSIVFFLLSVWWYLNADVDHPSPNGFRIHLAPSAWYWLSFIAFLLGMLSKGSIAILPAIVLWITWWRRPLTIRDLWRMGPFLVIAAALVAVNIWFQTHGSGEVIRDASLAERLAGAGAVIWFYLYKAF